MRSPEVHLPLLTPAWPESLTTRSREPETVGAVQGSGMGQMGGIFAAIKASRVMIRLGSNFESDPEFILGIFKRKKKKGKERRKIPGDKFQSHEHNKAQSDVQSEVQASPSTRMEGFMDNEKTG